MDIETGIQTALFGHIAVGNFGMEIAWPNTDFPGKNADGSTKAKPKSYLVADLIPNRNIDRFVGNGATVQHRGILQITVAYEAGKGTASPRRIADAIASHFAKGTRLTAEGVVVQIYERPSLAPPVQDGTHIRLPISILYRSFN